MLVKYNPFSIENTEVDMWGFVISEGKYSDITIKINDVSVEDNSDLMQLDFNILSKPDSITDKDLQSDEFNTTVEFIINDILKKAIDEYKN